MMSLSVDKMCAEKKEIRMPDTIYSLLVEKHFDQARSAALGLSGAFDEFSPLYNSSRKWKGFVINGQCYFFTPTSWSLFSDQHITLESIKVFNVNHLYWLPGELLESTLLKMPNLEELSIKGTQVCTVVQVAKILQSCPKIQQLDFTYAEKSQKEILTGLEKENISPDSLAASFQKLTSLKLSTTVPDRKHDVYKDPWLLIIKMLSYCRDCTDLAIEVTYTGETLSSPDDLCEKRHRLITEQLDVKEEIERNELPKLAWMKSLESLVLVKLGPSGTSRAGSRTISILLDSLIQFLFPQRGAIPSRPLKHMWIEGFEIHRCAALKYLSSEHLKSYLTGDCDSKDENYEDFFKLEHLGGMTGIDFSRPLPSLKKLKYASGHSQRDEKFYQFCQVYQELELEGLNVKFWPFEALPSDDLCKLPRLKSFSACERVFTKEFIKAMTDAYELLERLCLTNRNSTLTPDHKAILSAFRFPHLTFLSLSNFQLLDGAALIPIIQECPKLEVVHLETDTLNSTSFPSNLELFLRAAANLRDFRLEWNHEENVYPETTISILEALLNEAVKLERLALIDAGSREFPDWKHPSEFADFVVGFVEIMTHMTCCCLTFKQMDGDLMTSIKDRVENEVINDRPLLWFHLDGAIPKASDPGVPSIHYHQIVDPVSLVRAEKHLVSFNGAPNSSESLKGKDKATGGDSSISAAEAGYLHEITEYDYSRDDSYRTSDSDAESDRECDEFDDDYGCYDDYRDDGDASDEDNASEYGHPEVEEEYLAFDFDM